MALNVEFDGRSRRVRVTPATTMLQVAEDARAQFGLPAGAFQLLHRRRALDPALPFRLSGVPNNAALELQPLAAGAGQQQVRVCVQQADGKRVQAVVAADATLASVLEDFQLLPPRDGEFSLSFLQQEIAVDAFASTTLQDLGIVSGSAIFRVQPAAQSKTALGASHEAAVQPPPPSRAVTGNVRASPALQSSAHAASESKGLEQRAKPPPAPAAAPAALAPAAAADADEEMKEAVEPESVSVLSSYDSLQLLRDSCFDATAKAAITTLLKIVTNVLSFPDNEKMRSIRLSNAAFQRSVGQLRGGVEFLQSVGFVLDSNVVCLVLESAVDARAELEEGLRLLHTEADDLNIEEAARPQIVVPRAADPTFDVYKPQIHRMQAQPRGPSVTEVLVDNLKSKQEQLIGHEVPPRNTVVTLPGRPAAATPSGDTSGDVAMDDEHPSDSKILISTLKAKRAEAEKAKNFRTQAMRELDELKKKKVFQTTLIRVQFPDRVVLQAAFHPNEPVQAVIDYVKQSLEPALSHHAFYLYVTPPMQKLDPTKTLAGLNLVPAALAYLSWVDAAPVMAVPGAGFYLRDDLVTDELAESKESDEATAKVAYPKPIALEPEPSTAVKSELSDGAAPKSSSSSSSGSAAAASGKKKPAWLKLR